MSQKPARRLQTDKKLTHPLEPEKKVGKFSVAQRNTIQKGHQFWVFQTPQQHELKKRSVKNVSFWKNVYGVNASWFDS